jgi:hypothetical protein
LFFSFGEQACPAQMCISHFGASWPCSSAGLSFSVSFEQQSCIISVIVSAQGQHEPPFFDIMFTIIPGIMAKQPEDILLRPEF